MVDSTCLSHNYNKPISATWRVFWAVTLLLVPLVAAEILHISVGVNFHSVVPGRCYRCAQPGPTQLESYVRTHRIKTVLNLRGDNPTEDWFIDECAAAERLGMKVVHLSMAALCATEEKTIAQLIDAIEGAEEPILIHCRNGADRTGFASVAYLLLRTDTSFADARGQLSLRFGHYAWGRAACQHQILDLYESWLRLNDRAHRPEYFRYWGKHVYHFAGGKIGPPPCNRL